MTKDNLPTDKQAKAMELIRQGEKPQKAMIKAGYSSKTALHPNENLLQRNGVQNIIEQYKEAYTRVGITPNYMAAKTKEWLEAQKIKGSFTEPDRVVPDYETQLKAAEMVRNDWELGQEPNPVNQQTTIVVMPSELVQKYDISSNTENSSTGQP